MGTLYTNNILPTTGSRVDLHEDVHIYGDLTVTGSLNAKVTDFVVNANSTILGDSSGDSLTINAGTANIPNDLKFYDDQNNADPMLSLGTGDNERLTIQVLNGGSDKLAEEVHFSTHTAASGANAGKMVFDIDGTDILTIDDGGLDIASGKTFSINGSDISTTDTTYTAGDLIDFDGTQIDVDLSEASEAALADGDFILFLDGGATGTAAKEAIADVATLFAGTVTTTGLSASSSVLSLAIHSLNAEAIATGDFLAFSDAGDNGLHKESIDDIATLFAGTGLTASSAVIGVDTSQAITALTGGDLTIYDDTNNADVSLKMGTSAAESLTIQVLNGSSNKTAEEIHFSTATASSTANHGKMVFDIDGTDILSILDNGLLIESAIDDAAGPVVEIKNTDNGGFGGEIKFNNTEAGGDGADNDKVGTITFWGNDDGTPTAQQYAGILAEIHDATSDEESGKLTLQVASHDGGVENGLILVGGSADAEVDVTVGLGSASVVDFPGHIDLAGDIDVDGTANLDDVDIDGDVDLDGKMTIDPGTSGGTGIVLTATDVDVPGMSIVSTNLISSVHAGVQGADLVLDHNTSLTTSHSGSAFVIDYDKTHAAGSGVAQHHLGQSIHLNDGIANNAAANVYMTGSSIVVNTTDDAGTTINSGLQIHVAGADTNYALTTTSGLVGLGTDEPACQLGVYTNAASNVAAIFTNDGADANRYGIAIQCGADTTSQGGGTNGDSVWATLKGGSGTNLSFIVYSTSSPYAAFAASSDERLKRDIAPTKVEGLPILNGLGLSEFRWDKDGPSGNLNELGFIAQNCEQVYPEMVMEVDDEEQDFKVKTVAPAALIPVLVKAIQELSSKVDSLEEELSKK